jgi:superfamily II DNA or RNA helicase
VILRDYQIRAIDQVREAFRETRRVLLVMPTGAGKTATASQILAWAVARGRRCLFIVHRREIVQDTHRRLLAAGVSCGLVMAGQPTTDAPVQVCSVQTLAARGLHPPADLLVWDEAHHVAAATYGAIRAKYPEAWHLGLTATPERTDGKSVLGYFDGRVAAELRLWDARGSAPLSVVQAHDGKALCLDWIGEAVVTGGSDCAIAVHKLLSGAAPADAE